MTALENNSVVHTKVVAKALIRTKDELSLSSETVGQIIGTDASTISRIGKNQDMKANKSLEAALLLIRVYRSLYALMGGSKAAMAHWLNTENIDFKEQRPVDCMKNWVGLVEVVQYLDAMRGHA